MAMVLRSNDAAPVQLCVEWLAGQLSPHTARAYTADLEQFAGFVACDLAAVRREDLFRYRAWLMGQYAPATVNRKLAAVRQLYAEAVRHGVLLHSPADGLRGCRGEGNYRATKSPSDEQVRALLDSLKADGTVYGSRDLAMLYVMVGMGLRREEVSLLTVGSISEHSGHEVLEVIGKGNKRRRLTMPIGVSAAVRAWLGVRFEGTPPPDAPLFPEIKNKGQWIGRRALTPNGIYYVTLRRFQAAGIEGCSPHSCRHYFLTYVLTHGASLYQTQQMAGHTDPRTTEGYLHTAEGLDSSAASFVDF